MNVKMLRRVRRLFTVEGVPMHTQRHNQRQWIKSIRFLGERWLLAKPVERRIPMP